MKKPYEEADRRAMIGKVLNMQMRVTTLIAHLVDSEDPEWVQIGLDDLRQELDLVVKANKEFFQWGEDSKSLPRWSDEVATEDDIPF